MIHEEWQAIPRGPANRLSSKRIKVFQACSSLFQLKNRGFGGGHGFRAPAVPTRGDACKADLPSN